MPWGFFSTQWKRRKFSPPPKCLVDLSLHQIWSLFSFCGWTLSCLYRFFLFFELTTMVFTEVSNWRKVCPNICLLFLLFYGAYAITILIQFWRSVPFYSRKQLVEVEFSSTFKSLSTPPSHTVSSFCLFLLLSYAQVPSIYVWKIYKVNVHTCVYLCVIYRNISYT